MGFGNRLIHGWNAFKKGETTTAPEGNVGVEYGSGYSGIRVSSSFRSRIANEKSILTSMINRIAVDVASVNIKHVKTDNNGRYSSTMNSGLNYCLTRKANIDQSAFAFKLDMAMTLLEKGHIAVVPVDTTVDPRDTSGGFDIRTMRVGEVVQWYPRHVKVKVWNDDPDPKKGGGKFQEVLMSKENVAIVVNPFYAVMNEPLSTLQRLIRKLSLLDSVDEQASSGKLDLIVQLPYALKSDARREQAKNRQKDVENQLKGSAYGIAYLDATEKITQLNRPAENNMLAQIQFLTEQLFSHFGMTQEILNGTASESTMLNYNSRTIEPILNAITEAIANAFISKTGLTQGQSIEFFQDAFKLVPVSSIAEIADKFTRNEIMSSNEWRGVLGLAPSEDPKADQLRNANMPQPEDLGELTPVDPSQPQEQVPSPASQIPIASISS